jgi:hypothetical protein
MTVPSPEDWRAVEEADVLIAAFAEVVQGHSRDLWQPFAAALQKRGLFLGRE